LAFGRLTASFNLFRLIGKKGLKRLQICARKFCRNSTAVAPTFGWPENEKKRIKVNLKPAKITISMTVVKA
jgi:hypothetical protein